MCFFRSLLLDQLIQVLVHLQNVQVDGTQLQVAAVQPGEVPRNGKSYSNLEITLTSSGPFHLIVCVA